MKKIAIVAATFATLGLTSFAHADTDPVERESFNRTVEEQAPLGNAPASPSTSPDTIDEGRNATEGPQGTQNVEPYIKDQIESNERSTN